MLRRSSLAALALALISTAAQAAGPGPRAAGTFEHKADGYEQGVTVRPRAAATSATSRRRRTAGAAAA